LIESMLSTVQAEETMAPGPPSHEPVLLDEVLRALRPAAGGTFVDATLGLGGHSAALLDASAPDGRVLGIDRDPRALELCATRLAPHGDRFSAVRGDYRDLVALLQDAGIYAVDGILADLGVSSMQLDDPSRGFSFREDGPLDMRMDPDSGRTAADVVASADVRELTRILREYGEEREAGRIARAIVREREHAPILTTAALSKLVESTLGGRARAYRIHPATRTFQALRIAVNDELAGLDRFVADAVSMLKPGGRIAVIAFHSLEDRAIKTAFRSLAERCICPPGMPVCGCGRENLVRLVNRRALRPGDEEIDRNPRSRSARLRVAERL
jgi:16S rRNA (cytosine1402-N4)-methyltransferase